MLEIRLKTWLPVANALGECILWDEAKQELLWTDLTESRLYLHDLSTGATRHVQFDDYLCSFGLVKGEDSLICAFRTGIAIVDRSTWSPRWIHHLESHSGVRLNDGRVDRQGRFWVGSLIDGPTDPEGVSGELFSVNAKGRVRSHLDGILISNSLCWSPDGTTMYFTDTPTREILAFEFDTETGSLGTRSVFARTAEGAFPDGSTVDADGFLWNAEWGSGKVVRYAPDGRIDHTIDLPISQATCVAFGGEDLSDLYVSTAKIGLTEEALKAEPRAGHVFVFETSVRGLREVRFIARDALMNFPMDTSK